MSHPTVSVVVLSYNRPEALARSLRSVYSQNGAIDLEVIVVDNLSLGSPEVARVVDEFPGVRFLPQAANLGFAAGMNVGLQAATGEHVHLHEDDIFLDADFYANILAVARAHPRSILSGVIRDDSNSSLLFAGIELDIGRRFRQEAYSKVLRQEPYEVGMLIGAMMFGRRDVFRRVGLFRPEFFLYLEDAEYCWRARLLGVTLLVVPSAGGEHLSPGPFRHRSIIEHHKLKNYLAINLLYMPPIPLAILLVKYFLHTTVRKAVEDGSPRFLLKLWMKAMIDIPKYLSARRDRVRHSDLVS